MAAEESPTQLKTGLSKFILSEESLYTKADLLNSIQQNIIGLFQRKGSVQKSLSELHGEVKALLATEAGQFLGQFYEERLLKKGMWLLREELKDREKYDLLLSVADCWNSFYTEILPSLQAIMVDVPIRDRTMRQATLLAFRDEMLLKTPIADAMRAYTGRAVSRSRTHLPSEDTGTCPSKDLTDDTDQDDLRAALVQMFLVLLSVNRVPDEKYRKLEKMAASLISPLVTLSGIYYDGRLNQMHEAVVARTLSTKRIHSAGDLYDTSRNLGFSTPNRDEEHDGALRRLPAAHQRAQRSRQQLTLHLSPLLTVAEASVLAAGSSCPRDRISDSPSHV